MKWLQKRHKYNYDEESSPIEKISKARGVENPSLFLNPTKDVLHSPYKLLNVEKAVERIMRAIDNNERIVVAYDCDGDGITSATLLRRYLGKFSDKVDFIYGERSHGHGITEMLKVRKLVPNDSAYKTLSIDEIYESNLKFNNRDRFNLAVENSRKIQDADLLIIVDSSSNDSETCRIIQEKMNTDIIILDHHILEKENKNCIMVNPNNPMCEYPNKFLCGVSVVYKTLQVMEDKLGNQNNLDDYLDLVAVGTVSDMMNMNELENRYLVYKGMDNLKNTGLIRICKGAKVDTFKGLKTDSIGFSISPIINAVARMDNIKLAIDILMEDDDAKCKPLRLKMHKLNEERKKIQKEVTEKYELMLTEDDLDKKFIIIFDDESSKGFNGLVAQNLAVKYNRPVMVGRLHNGKINGSFRSVNGIKFKSIISQFSDDIFAIGHEASGGFGIDEEDLEEFKEFLQEVLPEQDEIEEVKYYDFKIHASEIDEWVNPVMEFNRVSGQGFPKIILRIEGLTIEESAVIGKTAETVKMKTFEKVELIKFRVPDAEEFAKEFTFYDEVEVIGELGLNEFYNFKLREKVITTQVLLADVVLN